VRSRSGFPNILSATGLLIIAAVQIAAPRSSAAEQSRHILAWLSPYIGEGKGQIAQVVLQRARALYLRKVHEGAVKNPCYFAMDATRPNDFGGRFYIICEAKESFSAVAAGHGGGRRHLKGIADFANGIRCAKNFGNAMDSKLTTGGAYVTAETKTSFKGYYRVSAKRDEVLLRSFVQFDGEDGTANARQREIGGHAAVLLREVCLLKHPDSPYADNDGYVLFGKLEDYASGRSNGCTSWRQPDAQKIVAMVKDDPTTLYIYPESADIEAVARTVKARQTLSHAGLYWNASCLKDIHFPEFWPQETLGPLLAQYAQNHPPGPPQPTPHCKRQ
jgi:hypothetical protein